MATIVQPQLTLGTTATTVNRVGVSFTVRFTATELTGGATPAVRQRYPFLPPGLLPRTTFGAEISLQVIRVIPRPVIGGSPPPLPDPVVLRTERVGVAVPRDGNTRNVSQRFTVGIIPRDTVIFDHLFARITLSRRTQIGPGSQSSFTFPVAFALTDFELLTFATLADPQPDGVRIG